MNDGGPAFPQTAHVPSGMSLREWYAGLAMQGMLASEAYIAEIIIPAEAFKMADAMLAESVKADEA